MYREGDSISVLRFPQANNNRHFSYMGLYHSDLLRMVTFIFCIYGASLGFMYLIYLSFSGREFIATPMACVKLGQTYLNRICTVVKRSPLHIEESSCNPEMQGCCLLHGLLYSAQQDVHELQYRALERGQAGVGNVSGETDLWPWTRGKSC